ncbi:MAG: asparagine synthase (glutamine-hydrolyzing) [Actinomycetota bacterium]
MCGIAVASTAAARAEVARMLSRLDHRGPDERGRFDSGAVTLGHSRLAIVAPQWGSQPLVGADGTVAVCNGEIYNHRSLREVPGGESGSDADVLLPLYREEGGGLARRLDGMYAFVILTPEGELVAGRDPLGIKPLYRAEREDGVAFASELKALAGNGWDRVETVPAGHTWEGGLRRHYRVPEPNLERAFEEADVEEWCRRLRHALESAVVKRLMSDVPLGAFLSGGLDSSIVTALAARHAPGLDTFSLGFEGSADVDAARLVAEHLGTNHHEVTVSEDEPLQVLPEVLYHLESWDRDLVRSALPTYLVARFAARHLKVVLTGEGADELFAGYAYHAGYAHDPVRLQRELHRSVQAMHDNNLQRVDRMTMAHSLEARVPFLDPEVVEVAMDIPPGLKLRRDRHGNLVEKWILRRAFSDLLPEEIVWRTKSQFDEGSGAVDRLVDLADSALGGGIPREPEARLRDVEEAWYFHQLRNSLGDWRTVRANTSVWAENRL